MEHDWVFCYSVSLLSLVFPSMCDIHDIRLMNLMEEKIGYLSGDSSLILRVNFALLSFSRILHQLDLPFAYFLCLLRELTRWLSLLGKQKMFTSDEPTVVLYLWTIFWMAIFAYSFFWWTTWGSIRVARSDLGLVARSYLGLVALNGKVVVSSCVFRYGMEYWEQTNSFQEHELQRWTTRCSFWFLLSSLS